MKKHRQANPKSKRSQKKAISHGLKHGNHAMACVAMADYKQRQNARDGRYSPNLNENDVKKIIGQSNETVVTQYRYEPTLSEVLNEARILYRAYEGRDKLVLKPSDFVNTAYVNILATGWQAKKTQPSKPSQECLRWLKKQKKNDDNSSLGTTSNGQVIHKINKK